MTCLLCLDPRLVFKGTPLSFLYSLRALLKAAFQVEMACSASDFEEPPSMSLAIIRLCSTWFAGALKSARVGADMESSVGSLA